MDSQASKKNLSEEDIKLRFITPAITGKWDRDTQVRMEYFFTDGRVMVRRNQAQRGKRKRADYILSYTPNFPVAIVEAKDNTHSVGAGLQQAMDYAAILDVPFAYASNGDEFIEYDFFTGTNRVFPLDQFPTPDELWERYRKGKNISDL